MRLLSLRYGFLSLRYGFLSLSYGFLSLRYGCSVVLKAVAPCILKPPMIHLVRFLTWAEHNVVELGMVAVGIRPYYYRCPL